MTNITTFSALSTSLKSRNTSRIYAVALNDFMKYRKVTNLSELLENETKAKLLESDIIEFLVYLKLERKTSWSFRNVRLSAIKHFYRMNDIELNWFKISKYLGEYNKVAHDRAYTTEEIQQLLTKCDDPPIGQSFIPKCYYKISFGSSFRLNSFIVLIAKQ
jgi:integrase